MIDTPESLKPIEFRTLRTVRIASTTGHIINMEPGVPVMLPPAVHAEAYAMGCVPVDAPDNATPLVPLGEDRERAVIDAIHVLITKGDNTKFRKDGVPKVDSIEKIFGFAVTAIEVEAAFSKVKAISDALNEDKEELTIKDKD